MAEEGGEGDSGGESEVDDVGETGEDDSEGDQEDDPEGDKPISKRVFKKRIDKLIDQRDVAKAEAADTRSRLEQLRLESEARARQLQELEVKFSTAIVQRPADVEDEDEDDLVVIKKELRQLREKTDESERQRKAKERIDRLTAQLTRDIGSALKVYKRAEHDDVVHEMRLDDKLTALQSAKIVHERELAREKKILAKHAKGKKAKGDAARRPPTQGGTAAPPAEEGKPKVQTEQERRQAMAAAMSKYNVFGKP